MSKIAKILVSILGVAIIVTSGIMLYIYWPAITTGFDKSKYYSFDELQGSYNRGYSDGNEAEDEMSARIDYFNDLVDEYYNEVNNLNQELSQLQASNTNLSSKVTILTNQKTSLQSDLDNLNQIKVQNESTITSLNLQVTGLQIEIVNLQSQVDILTQTQEINTEQVASLNHQIDILNWQVVSLNNTISNLQTSNQLNYDLIASLNTQISNLNSQISNMTDTYNNNTDQVSALEKRISELQNSVSYYQNFIENLENGSQVVATFEFNGSVYNIQIVAKNSIVLVTEPISTEFVIFNGWTVGGELVDLSTYEVNINTRFVADVTIKNKVEFIVDETIASTQAVLSTNFATEPTIPTKEMAEFMGWSINGVDVIDVSIYEINSDTQFVAVWTNYYLVSFLVNEEVVATQLIEEGKNAEVVADVEVPEGYIFINWGLDATIFDFDSHKIYQNTNLTAIIYEIKDLNSYSWLEIDIISRSGKALNLFSAGDIKEGTLGNKFQIVAFNHNELADGSGVGGITFINLNPVNGNILNYSFADGKSLYHRYLVPMFFESQLKSVLKDVQRWGYKTTAKCFLPSIEELIGVAALGEDIDTESIQGNQFEIWPSFMNQKTYIATSTQNLNEDFVLYKNTTTPYTIMPYGYESSNISAYVCFVI